jgi:hypothetical protein
MNSIREIDPHGNDRGTLQSLMQEAAANIRARNGAPVVQHQPFPKNVFDGPKYEGKQCAECKRPFKASSEYLSCKLCPALVCRRKGTCKGCHHAEHRVAFLKAQKEATNG